LISEQTIDAILVQCGLAEWVQPKDGGRRAVRVTGGMRDDTGAAVAEYENLIQATVKRTAKRLGRARAVTDLDDIESDARYFFAAVYQQAREEGWRALLNRAMKTFPRQYAEAARVDGERSPRPLPRRDVSDSGIPAPDRHPSVEEWLEEEGCPCPAMVAEEYYRREGGGRPSRCRRWHRETLPAVRGWFFEMYPEMARRVRSRARGGERGRE
jgi:hypothetical protein